MNEDEFADCKLCGQSAGVVYTNKTGSQQRAKSVDLLLTPGC